MRLLREGGREAGKDEGEEARKGSRKQVRTIEGGRELASERADEGGGKALQTGMDGWRKEERAGGEKE